MSRQVNKKSPGRGLCFQFDKRSGITYIYELQSVWDKERKLSRSVRRLIGRPDAKTGEIIATDGRHRGGKALDETIVPGKPAPPKEKTPEVAVSAAIAERKFCRATCLLDAYMPVSPRYVLARECRFLRRASSYL